MNATGVGKMMVEPLDKTRVNTRICPRCGAKPGQTCFILTATTFRELKQTHTEFSVPKHEYREKNPAPPTALELERRKKSTEILDRRYKAKKAREAERKARANGIRRPSDPMK
jgi:hypothetical protein